MADEQSPKLDIEDLFEQLRAQILIGKMPQDDKEKFLKRTAYLERIVDSNTETVAKLETITGIQAASISNLESLLNDERVLASRYKAEHDTKSKDLEKKLASKEKELAAAILKTEELQKKHDQIQKMEKLIKPIVGSVIPKKKPSDEESNIDCGVIFQNLKKNLGMEYDLEIYEWRREYKAAESLRRIGNEEYERYRYHKDQAASLLSQLKGYIALERKRAEDLQEMQSLE